MKKLFMIAAVLFAINATVFAQGGKYKFTIDLTAVQNDKVPVELETPSIKADEITYFLPKIVPGTYSEDDFGRYVEGFAAYDKKGNALTVERINDNSWKIKNASKLRKINYWVNDTFDDRDPKSKKIFEPTGSNIQQDSNFIINTHCFIGYFDGMKQNKYELTVKHPENFYGSTAMVDKDKSAATDKFVTESYNRLVDNPLMYCAPDTVIIPIGKSEVLLSVYSPNKKVSAASLREKMNELLQAQGKYLGGLPVDKYAFLIYLTDRPGVSGAQGALEHSYSSMYYMPEAQGPNVVQFLLNVAAHEFFHIVTPLNIHSEEIQYFDFNEPKMSQHLWMYEGTTEYHAHIMQEKYGLITKDEFLTEMSSKITNSRNNYNDTMPFTVMSANVLQEKYEKQYGNVYEKGALIAMSLDIKLRQLSGGKYGILNLMFDLSKKYGKDKPFKDNELFDDITRLTYPEIRTFLDTYVAGNQPLPLTDIFNTVGVDFIPVLETKDSTFSVGSISFKPNVENGRVQIADISKMNELGKKLGYQVGDEIIAINGTDIPLARANATINGILAKAKVGEPLSIEVRRKNSEGKTETKTLTANFQKFPIKKYNQLKFAASPTAAQTDVRNSWLNP